MLAIFIILAWVTWLVVRAYLRRRDPEGLALLIGEEEARELHPAGYARRQASYEEDRRVAVAQGYAQPQTAAAQTTTTHTTTSPYVRPAAPPAAGALQPRTAAGYGTIPGYDRRRGDRRGYSHGTQTPSQERRTGRDRRSA